MRKTKNLYVLRMLSSHKIPFIVLLIFSFLATTLYTAISWSGIAMEKSVYGYCEDRNLFDISLTAPVGFTQEGIDRLLCTDGIDEVEGVRLAYGFFAGADTTFTAKVMTITEKIAVLSVTEGTLPTKENEIAIEGNWAKKNGICVGDVIVTGKECTALREDSFTITALVETPVLVNTSMHENMAETGVPLDTLLFTSAKAFRDTPFSGFESVYLRSNSLRQFSLSSDEYAAEAKKLKETVSPIAKDEVSRRYDSLAGYSVSVPVGETSGCFIQTADELGSFPILQAILDLFVRLKYVLSLPFVLVCLAVSCSVILRLTSDDASGIGLQLAMGTSGAQVTSTYLMFSTAPIIFGSVLGTLAGCLICESLIIGTISSIWAFEERILVFRWGEALGAVAIITLLMSAAVVVSCRVILKRNVLSLLNGAEIPAVKKAFYEKTRLWKKLSLLTKSIINNIRTDRVRVTVTLVGIICCTALSISGLYMIRSINAGYVTQFDTVQGYETVIYYDAESDAEDLLTAKLTENGIASLPIYTGSVFLHAPDGQTLPASMLVSGKDWDGWIDFYAEDGGKLESEGKVLLSRPYANEYNLSNGAVVKFTLEDGSECETVIDGAFDFYLVLQQIVLPPETYEAFTGKTVRNNALLVAGNRLSVSETDALLRDIDGYYHTYDYKTVSYTGYEIYLRLAVCVAGILIVLSVSMAFFMLLNLFVQFVSEKKREIITMMINGYSLGYVQQYIYLDTVFLGLIGILAGAVLGNLFGALDVNTLYSNSSYYPQSIDVVACLEGMGISAVFTACMCLRALSQIKGFNVSDLNKV